MPKQKRWGGTHVQSKTKLEEAAGGAVIGRGQEGLELVLICTHANGMYRWSLPKGHFKKRETREETALREVREETGLHPEIIEPLGTIDYWFTEGATRYHKYVHYFLMRSLGGSFEDHDDEVVEARWFGMEEALKQMAYPTERELIEGVRARVAELFQD